MPAAETAGNRKNSLHNRLGPNLCTAWLDQTLGWLLAASVSLEFLSRNFKALAPANT